MDFKNLDEDQLINLNAKLPILLIIILLIVNFEYFVIVYIESFIEIIKLYLFFSFLVFALEFIKYKIKNRTVIKLNIYKVGVINSFLVLIFLVSNSFYSKTIFTTQIKYDIHYNAHLKKYSIPNQFKHLYEIELYEKEEYLYKNYILDIKVGETFFGYKIIEEREFKDPKNI